MEIKTKPNPEETYEAVINPAPLSLAKIAILEKIEAPILQADISQLNENIVAVWIYANDVKYVASNLEKRLELALEYVDTIGGKEYGEKLTELVKGITAFFMMLPQSGSADEGECGIKKKSVSETDGQRSCASGHVGRIHTLLNMFWKNVRRFVLLCFTGVLRRDQEV